MGENERWSAGFFRASAVNTPRAMTLCAVGALIGLGIAGYGLFTAAGTSTRRVPPENIATINRRPILRSDFVTQLESETGKRFDATSRTEQLKVLDDMVREELLVQRGLELDFAETDQGARNALASAISDQALTEVTTGKVTEAELREYFDRNPGRWASEGVMTLRNFVLPARAEGGGSSAPAAAVGGAARNTAGIAQGAGAARKASAALRAGMPPEEAAGRYGLTELQRQDEEYYFAVRYRLGDALFEKIASLSDGEISPPLPAPDGIHIIQMIKNLKPVPLSFKAARPQVVMDYNDAMQSRIMDNTMKFLRGRAVIDIADDYAGEYKP